MSNLNVMLKALAQHLAFVSRWSLWSFPALVFAGYVLVVVTQANRPVDYEMFARTAAALRAGQDAYLPSGPDGFRPLNPPHFHLVVLPYVLWQAANVLSFVIACAMVVPRETWWRWTGGFLVAGVLLAGPSIMQMISGQTVGILTFLLACSWRWRDSRPTTAGCALGLLCSVKPFLGVVWLWFVTTRRSRVASVAVLTALMAYALGLLVYGPEASLAWLAALRGVTWQISRLNASMAAFGWPLPVHALAAGVVCVTALRYRRTEHGFLLAIVASILSSPLGWIYYLWLPAPWLIRRSTSEGFPAVAWLLLLPPPVVLRTDVPLYALIATGLFIALVSREHARVRKGPSGCPELTHKSA